MTETNPIHPDVRRFAIETNADRVRSMGDSGDGRVEYTDGCNEIIGLGIHTDIPDGFNANLTFGTTPSIDLFPR